MHGTESLCVIDLALSAPWRIAALQAVAALDLPDAWISAGFVRAPVWDRLHGYETPTPLDDVDVIYFDSEHRDAAIERGVEKALTAQMPDVTWQVRNQARMHERNCDSPYGSSADALCHWLETPTAVAVRLGSHAPELLAPLGLDDLLNLRLRPTPYARANRLEAYQDRLRRKRWTEQWPKIEVDWGD